MDRDNIARNGETLDLLWAMNPYVLGTSDKKPTAGYTHQGLIYQTANCYPIGCIEAVERAHGFGPPYSIAPEIHYKPKPPLHDVKDCVLVDLNAISSSINARGLDWMMTKMNARFLGSIFYMLTFPEGIIREHVPISGPSIQVNSIYEYVDMLAQCRALVCSEAGSQALAAAVRGEYDVHELDARPEIVSLITPMTYNSRGYTFRGVDYRVTTQGQNNTHDYFSTPGSIDPPEVGLANYNLVCKRTVEEARAIWDARKAKDAAQNG